MTWRSHLGVIMKTCSKCGCEKPFDKFNKRNDRKSGLTSQCKDCINANHKTEEYRTYKRNWEKNCDKNKRRATKNKTRAKRILKDPLYKLEHNLRGRLQKVITRKSDSFKNILGCSCDELQSHLSYKFKERYDKEFDWNLYAENNQQYGWHIDHVIELHTAMTERELYELCHYSNLEFRWWKENLEKYHNKSDTI